MARVGVPRAHISYIHKGTHIHICASYTGTHTHSHTCTHTCTHICTHICTTQKHTYTGTYIMHSCMHMYVHTYTCAPTNHIYIHTQLKINKTEIHWLNHSSGKKREEVGESLIRQTLLPDAKTQDRSIGLILHVVSGRKMTSDNRQRTSWPRPPTTAYNLMCIHKCVPFTPAFMHCWGSQYLYPKQNNDPAVII